MKNKKNDSGEYKSLIRWLNLENTLLSKILQRNFVQHRRQPFLIYTKLALKNTINFVKELKSNKPLKGECLDELHELGTKCIKIIIRAGVELSRIHVHRHFTQLITTLIACLSRLHILIKKWFKLIIKIK